MQVIPGGFSCLRPQQELMADRIREQIASRSQSSVHCAPTGTGKTLAYITGCLWSPARRAVILTHTKALQDQILRDFRREVVDVRGASNFQCGNHWGTCEDGMAMGCASQLCRYKAQFSHAASYRAIVTNYAMWAYNSQALGMVDALVCDEAHLLDRVLTDCCSLLLTHREAKDIGHRHGYCGPANSIGKALTSAVMHPDTAAQSTDERLRRKRNQEVLSAMLADKSDIVITENDKGVTVRTLWPVPWVRRLLAAGGRSLILASATISREYAVNTLGLKDSEYYAYASPFDPAKAPIYLLPSGRMSHDASEDAVSRVFRAACNICRQRESSKGIIHTVSYRRAREFVNFARNLFPEQAVRMIEDAPGTEHKRRYLESENDILVSASASTGYDFPDADCRWQIVIKAPYADLGDPLVRCRSQRKNSWLQVSMLDALVQMCGRNVRHAGDYGETFVVDSAACEALTHPQRVPEWVKARIRRLSAVSAIPKEEIACRLV